MYLSIGSGRHVDEVRFSILSAARYLQSDSAWKIVLYTDRPAAHADLPVELKIVDEVTAADWIGSYGYVWRAKIKSIADALAEPGVARCAIVDGDTYFRRSPNRLFSRIDRGRSVMHLCEGWPPPAEVAAVDRVTRVHIPVDLNGRSWPLGSGRATWNSGVVGLHRTDAQLCEEVSHLADQLLGHGFGDVTHTAEQVAFAVCLEQRTRLRGSQDVIVHYWRDGLKESFGPVLQEVLSRHPRSPADQFDELWPQRPHRSRLRRIKSASKRGAWSLGVRL